LTISEKISMLQDRRNETNYRLAKSLGVSQTTVANWRSGKTKPLRVYTVMLADHFGVSVEDLKEDGA